ncbi:MAG: lactonase family protein [Bacteroidota bacterium]
MLLIGWRLYPTMWAEWCVCMYPIEENGKLGVATQVITLEGKGVTPRQEGSHPHSVNISPDNKFLLVADLGTDKIMMYQIDFENAQLLPNQPAFVQVQAGAGPRHLTFHPNDKYAYVVNELDATVNVFDYADGQLTEKQSLSTLPPDFTGENWCADIHVHPSGKFLYASNRGHDSIVIFEIDETNGTLTRLGHEPTLGQHPRNFMIEPSGKHLWVANQNSDNVVKFAIDPKTGLLTKVDQMEVMTPVCLQFFKGV